MSLGSESFKVPAFLLVHAFRIPDFNRKGYLRLYKSISMCATVRHCQYVLHIIVQQEKKGKRLDALYPEHFFAFSFVLFLFKELFSCTDVHMLYFCVINK